MYYLSINHKMTAIHLQGAPGESRASCPAVPSAASRGAFENRAQVTSRGLCEPGKRVGSPLSFL